ncbi:hypothetical protein [Leptothoe kymatousa]|uniref:Uncharacterized protein n=1 Tax=Leptothoe kymatousa TAU-MAC 1615 TaxID=2364775 RepID=A0ABS5Y4I1_9CYAN|nr:hypothetical protein [Leptothoe kymatousa]MBT9312716.1 hypothetical protein [Leptothoe kymatousa TAU-MAC 1615]
MQGTNNGGKGGETINRCITAVAMTIAIATIYTGMITEGQMVQGDGLREQIQTVFKHYKPELQITQDAEEPQESLATLVLTTQDGVSGH